ncbi:venom acid phosphatase Acph-1 [Stomoxys calcitrans]|uniref:venom acid phosphatase Acph-1 n=1 Tax=Stomoxys calcitrans TaxID=35570 RepID=UPI0027E2F75B|nr:venom acid phosphatase Acph-1 [Stomoxys calcitrans]XP_059227037.1 venom acid phosphatase Acph-1 [Stomoxys calcitrans]
MARSHFTRKHCLAMTASASLLVLTFLVLGLLFQNSAFADDQSTLQLLHVLFRHGPRTPADTYPNDPHVNQTYFPYGWGHITNSGKRELFNIGTWMRKRYGKFLGDMYFPNLLHAQSTGVVRTHMSMQTVLASFFPPKNSPMEWNSKYNWQPIPVFSQELNEDTFLLVRKPCPRYFEAFNEVMNTPEIKEEIKPHEYLFPELTALTGMNITEPEDINSLYLTLLAEEEYGLQLPDWTKEYYPEKLQFLAEQALIYNIYTREMQKIKAGPFLTKMFTEMKNKASNTLAPKERKMYIYTGHDSTVVNIMHALKVWKRQLPRYSAMLLVETHKNKETGEYYVELYFRNNPKEPAQPLTVPGCDFQCPLEKFVKLSADVVIDSDLDADRCKSKNEEFTEPPLRGP